MSNEGLVGLLGALLGAVVGGFIAAATNAFFAWRSERDRRLAIAHSVTIKVLKIADTVFKLCKTINAAWAEASGEYRWREVLPLMGLPRDHIEFTPEELALFWVGKQDDFASELSSAANWYNLLLDLAAEYKSTRADLLHELTLRADPRLSMASGQIVIDGQTRAVLAPKLGSTEDAVTQLHQNANAAVPMVVAMARAVGPALSKLLRDRRYTRSLDIAEPVTSHESMKRAVQEQDNG